MLLSLKIENFALIDALTVEFGRGLHVLTGETGAGKSILLDAIDAVLGGRTTARSIRSGATVAAIAAEFALSAELRQWLNDELGIAVAGDRLTCAVDLTLTEPKSPKGRPTVRSRLRVNGRITPKATVLRLRDRLVEIAAQGQTAALMDGNCQRDWLDDYGGPKLLKARQTVATAHAAARAAQQALDQHRTAIASQKEQREFLAFQLTELRTAQLDDPQELIQLTQERDRLSHAVELQQHSYQVYQLLYGGEGDDRACADLLGKAEAVLSQMLPYDDRLAGTLEMVSSALAQVVAAGQDIHRYGTDLEGDPQRLETVNDRLATLKTICRKYGPDLADAIARQRELENLLGDNDGQNSTLEKLEQERDRTRQALETACDRLRSLRQTAAHTLEARLTAAIAPLGMDQVQFQVSFEDIAPTPQGRDRIIYCFSPNPGEPLQPLQDTASGGEMSRFLLALKTCFSQVDPVETLIFDEIDAGVSGRVAQAIAQQLHQLAQHHQVLCVTHQPIVAAMADRHYRVDKRTIQTPDPAADPAPDQPPPPGVDPSPSVRTVVRLTMLDPDRRRIELAQLASGALGDRTDEAHTLAAASAFADSLLDRAASLRQPTP